MIGPKYERKPRRRDTSKSDSQKAYKAVEYRAALGFDGPVCEYCGKKPATEIHHRQYRSRGGLDLVVNLIHLCKADHDYAHSGIDAAIEGLAVGSMEDPAVRPVWYRGCSVLLLPAYPWFVDQTVHF